MRLAQLRQRATLATRPIRAARAAAPCTRRPRGSRWSRPCGAATREAAPPGQLPPRARTSRALDSRRRPVCQPRRPVRGVDIRRLGVTCRMPVGLHLSARFEVPGTSLVTCVFGVRPLVNRLEWSRRTRSRRCQAPRPSPSPKVVDPLAMSRARTGRCTGGSIRVITLLPVGVPALSFGPAAGVLPHCLRCGPRARGARNALARACAHPVRQHASAHELR
jgi:hypothetical protein